jgi:hypothetical protein
MIDHNVQGSEFSVQGFWFLVSGSFHLLNPRNLWMSPR